MVGGRCMCRCGRGARGGCRCRSGGCVGQWCRAGRCWQQHGCRDGRSGGNGRWGGHRGGASRCHPNHPPCGGLARGPRDGGPLWQLCGSWVVARSADAGPLCAATDSGRQLPDTAQGGWHMEGRMMDDPETTYEADVWSADVPILPVPTTTTVPKLIGGSATVHARGFNGLVVQGVAAVSGAAEIIISFPAWSLSAGQWDIQARVAPPSASPLTVLDVKLTVLTSILPRP